MADSVRIVRFTAGGQIEELLHIQSSVDFTVTNMGFERDSFDIAQGDRNQRMVKRGGRYDGEFYAGESLGNDTYKFRLLSAAPTADSLLAKLSQVIAELERVPGQHYIEHMMDGATYPSYKEVRAPAKRSPVYRWAQQSGAGSMVLDVEWPVAPLTCGPPMNVFISGTIADHFSEFTFDAGAANAWGIFAPNAESRVIYTDRGYECGSQEVTVKVTPTGSPVNGFKAGVVVKRVSDDTYLEVYVDDDGTNSRLRIDTVIGGARTNIATTNLAARVASGTPFWVRGRLQGSNIYALHFLAAPTPTATPANETGVALSGAAADLGAGIAGFAGAMLVAKTTAGGLEDFAVRPYTFLSPFPTVVTVDVPIPGDAPALGAFTVTPYSGSATPVFAMLGWAGRTDQGFATNPFGVYHAYNAINLAGFSSTADAGAVSGERLAIGTWASTGTAEWLVDINRIFPDEDASAQMGIEIWGRIRLTAEADPPKIVASLRFGSNPNGEKQFTSEYGRNGKPLQRPSSGTVYKFFRLGTIPVKKPMDDSGVAYLRINGAADFGGSDAYTGSLGIDYLFVVPVSRRACSPSSKSNDSSYPAFVPSTTALTRLIQHDLTGYASAGIYMGAPSTGLGGAPILFPPGRVDVAVKLSSEPPDPPVSTSHAEQSLHSASVQVGPIIPRWLHLRDQ